MQEPEERIVALEERVRSLEQEYSSDKKALKTSVIVASVLLALFFGITYGQLSNRINEAIKRSLVEGVESAKDRADTAAKNAEVQYARATAAATAIEQTKAQLTAGEFNGNISLKGNISAQGKISANGGFGKADCELVDGLNKDDDLWCKEGFYVAGAKNYSDSGHILDKIWCCRPR